MTPPDNFAAAAARAAMQRTAARTTPTAATPATAASRPQGSDLRRIGKAGEIGRGKGKLDKISGLVFLSDVATAAINTAVSESHLDAVGAGVDILAAFKKLLDTPSMPDNPLLDETEYARGRPSPATLEYLRSRTRKKVGGGIFGTLGMASSAHTAGINVHKLVAHLNALGSTGVHLHKLRGILETSEAEEDREIIRMVEHVVKMKRIKVARRSVNVALSSVPGSAIPGIDDSIATTVAGGLMTIEGVGTPMHQGWQCYAVAAALHRHAYREHRGTLRLKGSLATRTIAELFQRRGATRLGGQYNVIQFIREPAGWLAIGDKLMLS